MSKRKQNPKLWPRLEEWKAVNREHWQTHDPYQETPTKKCRTCEADRSSKEFHRSMDAKDGLQPECNVCKKESYRKNIVKRLLRNAEMRAARFGMEFSITTDDIAIPDTCPVLGIPIRVGENGQHHGSPTIDRWDNSKGYIPDNVRVISWRANDLKHDATVEELEKVLVYMNRMLRSAIPDF